MTRANLDWKKLDFGYRKTDFNVRCTYSGEKWGEINVFSEETIPLHMAATCLHYGQEAFEGLKAYEQKNGDIVLFRVEENARRMIRSCERVMMQAPSEELFIEAVHRAVDLNRKYVPPYGTGASLYVRPLVIGTSPKIGVKPASEYLFVVFVTPVGPYFKSGFKPVSLVVEETLDRAAPGGVGNVKVGGNYAAGMMASTNAKKAGYTEVLYLDSKEKKYIDESGPANFFGITKDKRYITPQSDSILPSITNMSLFTLASELGMNPERRPIPVDELFDLVDAGCCGTAAVITPVGSITYRDRKAVYVSDDTAGEYCQKLYDNLMGIQLGLIPDEHGWIKKVPSF